MTCGSLFLGAFGESSCVQVGGGCVLVAGAKVCHEESTLFCSFARSLGNGLCSLCFVAFARNLGNDLCLKGYWIGCCAVVRVQCVVV